MQIQSIPIFAVVAIVVICFKFSNFAYANTVISLAQYKQAVVICFKFSNFAYANTVIL